MGGGGGRGRGCGGFVLGVGDGGDTPGEAGGGTDDFLVAAALGCGCSRFEAAPGVEDGRGTAGWRGGTGRRRPLLLLVLLLVEGLHAQGGDKGHGQGEGGQQHEY